MVAIIINQSLEGTETSLLSYISDMLNVVCNEESRRISIRRICYDSMHYYLRVVEDEWEKGNIKCTINIDASKLECTPYRILGMRLLVPDYKDGLGFDDTIVKNDVMLTKAYNKARPEIIESLGYISNKHTAYQLLNLFVGERESMERC